MDLLTALMALVTIGRIDHLDIDLDGERKQIHAICGEGTITVVQQQNADHYVTIGQVGTAPGARTGLFVAAQRTLCVAIPAQRSAPAEIRVYKVK